MFPTVEPVSKPGFEAALNPKEIWEREHTG